MELELFSLLIKNKTFEKWLKSTISSDKTSEDTNDDEKAHPLRRGALL